MFCLFFFFSSRRRHTRLQGDWSSDVCSSDLLTFSKGPLQDEHPEWPSDVRAGIAAGKLVGGMTVEPARILVGAPLSVSASEENGAKTETWLLRQDPGKVLGWNKKHGAWKKVSTQTGFPTSITFKNGTLLSIGGEAARNLDP